MLADNSVDPCHKVYSVFVLSCLVDNYPTGQESAKQNSLIALCTYLITDKNSRDYKNHLLRQWCCICLGLCWQNYPEARWEGVRNKAHQHLIELVADAVPEVRAAAIFALGTYIGCGPGNEGTQEQTNNINSEIVNALIKEYDIVFVVRKELIAALFNYVNQFLTQSLTTSMTSNGTTSGFSSIVSSTNQSSQSSNPSTTNNSIRNLNSNNNNNNIATSTPIRHSLSSSAISSQAQNNNTLFSNGNSTLNNSRSVIQTIEENTLLNNSNSSKQKQLAHSVSTTQGFTAAAAGAVSSSSPNQVASQMETSFSSTSTPINTNRQASLTSSSSGISSNNNSTPTINDPTSRSTTQRPSLTQTNSFISTANRPIYALFNRVWNLLIEMQNDPYPEVAELAVKVVAYFVSQSHNFDMIKRNTIKQYETSMRQSTSLSDSNLSSSNLTDSNTNETHQQQQQQQVTPIQIQTDFVPWCCKYFLRPLLPTEPNLQLEELLVKQPIDVYTVDFLDQHCKLLYNHKVKRKQAAKWHGQSMDEISQMKHSSTPIHCRFHPYDDLLFVVDLDAQICIYDLQTKTFKTSFSNCKRASNNLITSFKLINAQHELMLLTGAADRVVRVFKPDLAQFQTHKLVTAFTAFGYNEKKNSKKEAGLIVEWDEANEILMCAGDTETIRVWDMNKELYKDYPTQQNSCVSCLSTHDNFTVAGFGDGTIKLFDFRRASPVNLRNDSFSFNGSMPLMNTSRQLSSSSYEKFEHIPQHRAYVHSVKIHKPSYTLVSASILGDFNVYDLRNQQKVFRSQLAKSTDETSAFECHPFNQLIAM